VRDSQQTRAGSSAHRAAERQMHLRIPSGDAAMQLVVVRRSSAARQHGVLGPGTPGRQSEPRRPRSSSQPGELGRSDSRVRTSRRGTSNRLLTWRHGGPTVLSRGRNRTARVRVGSNRSLKTFRIKWRRFLRTRWRTRLTQSGPMTRLLLATATTSGVIVGNSLIWTTRSDERNVR
jgi:hypothetical protein